MFCYDLIYFVLLNFAINLKHKTKFKKWLPNSLPTPFLSFLPVHRFYFSQNRGSAQLPGNFWGDGGGGVFFPSLGGFIDLTFMILRINFPFKLRRYNKVYVINIEFGLCPKVHHVLHIKDDMWQHTHVAGYTDEFDILKSYFLELQTLSNLFRCPSLPATWPPKTDQE